MRFRFGTTLAAFLAIALLGADTAAAQQTLNFSIGYFTIRGEDGRGNDDVLVRNRDLFLFDYEDFNTTSFGAEYLAPIGEYLEAGAGIGFTTRTVDTIYADFERPSGAEIEQRTKLRIMPLAATLRILPLGRNAAVQPYVGGGIALYNWRYAESGDFIDFTLPGRPIYNDIYTASGNTVGPVAVFGLRVPVGNVAIGGEVRYQKASADLDTTDFLGSKLDLGGLHYSATVGIRW